MRELLIRLGICILPVGSYVIGALGGLALADWLNS